MGSDNEKDDLQNTFDGSAPAEGGFLHPHAGLILEGAEKILKESATGSHLLRIAREYNIRTKVTDNMNMQGYNAENATVYVLAPPEQTQAEVSQAIDLAGFLREAEQGIIGFKPLDQDSDPEERESLMHAKNLDMIVEMCRIALELKFTDKGPALRQELLDRGYKKIFEAYEEQLGQDALLNAYIETVSE